MGVVVNVTTKIGAVGLYHALTVSGDAPFVASLYAINNDIVDGGGSAVLTLTGAATAPPPSPPSPPPGPAGPLYSGNFLLPLMKDVHLGSLACEPPTSIEVRIFGAVHVSVHVSAFSADGTIIDVTPVR